MAPPTGGYPGSTQSPPLEGTPPRQRCPGCHISLDVRPLHAPPRPAAAVATDYAAAPRATEGDHEYVDQTAYGGDFLRPSRTVDELPRPLTIEEATECRPSSDATTFRKVRISG